MILKIFHKAYINSLAIVLFIQQVSKIANNNSTMHSVDI